MRQILLLILITASGSLCAQGEFNHWVFGENAGINFNSGSPLPYGPLPINTNEGSASISDASGNLLFYTDGMTVWDKNNVVMPNGTGLMGHSSATQSAMIVSDPGNLNRYYIITADASALNSPPANDGVRYSVVDMSLNSGNGAVVNGQKNILLLAQACEKLACTRAVSGCEIWIVAHAYGNKDFYSWKITAQGIQAPVVSSVGRTHGGTNWSAAIGEMRISPNGQKILTCVKNTSNPADPNSAFAELLDFNSATGQITNPVNLPLNNGFGAYGGCFSPDNSKVYVTEEVPSVNTGANLYQFDLNNGLQRTTLWTSNTNFPSNQWGGVQLGPDGKVYVALRYFITPNGNSTSISVINNPNVSGSGCNYVHLGLALVNGKCAFGLPNSVCVVNPQPLIPGFTFTGSCAGQAVTFTDQSQTGINSWSWNFGDPGSGPSNTSALQNPSHIFNTAGSYTITLIVSNGCLTDTLQQVINIINCAMSVSLQGASLCAGGCASLTANVNGGTAPYSYSWTPNVGNGPGPYLVCPVVTTTYTVTVTDANGLSATSVALVSVFPGPQISSTVQAATCNSANGSATMVVVGSGPFTYQWSTIPVQTQPTATGLSGGTYTCIITDDNGCSATATVTITVSGAPTVNLFPGNLLCFGDQTGAIVSQVTGGNGPYTYLWSNGSSGASISALTAGNYTCMVTDASGCTSSSQAIISEPPALQSWITPVGSVCTGSEVSLEVFTSGGTASYSYSWPGIGSFSSSPVVVVNSDTLYTVYITDANGCRDTVSMSIQSDSCTLPAAPEFTFWAPNAFTPEGDGNNDAFLPIGMGWDHSDYRLMIFDRWGALIFSSTKTAQGWDGRANGGKDIAQEDVYVWRVEVKEEYNGTPHTFIGHVSIIR